MIDQLDRQVAELERELRARGAEHPYVSLLQSVRGVARVIRHDRLGDRRHRALPVADKLAGYTGSVPDYLSWRTDSTFPAGSLNHAM